MTATLQTNHSPITETAPHDLNVIDVNTHAQLESLAVEHEISRLGVIGGPAVRNSVPEAITNTDARSGNGQQLAPTLSRKQIKEQKRADYRAHLERRRRERTAFTADDYRRMSITHDRPGTTDLF